MGCGRSPTCASAGKDFLLKAFLAISLSTAVRSWGKGEDVNLRAAIIASKRLGSSPEVALRLLTSSKMPLPSSCTTVPPCIRRCDEAHRPGEHKPKPSQIPLRRIPRPTMRGGPTPRQPARGRAALSSGSVSEPSALSPWASR